MSGYLAQSAATSAAERRRWSGRKARLASDGALFIEIARLLGLGWSREQIAGRRKRIERGMEQQSGLSVSHEAI